MKKATQGELAPAVSSRTGHSAQGRASSYFPGVGQAQPHGLVDATSQPHCPCPARRGVQRAGAGPSGGQVRLRGRRRPVRSEPHPAPDVTGPPEGNGGKGVWTSTVCAQGSETVQARVRAAQPMSACGGDRVPRHHRHRHSRVSAARGAGPRPVLPESCSHHTATAGKRLFRSRGLGLAV